MTRLTTHQQTRKYHGTTGNYQPRTKTGTRKSVNRRTATAWPKHKYHDKGSFHVVCRGTPETAPYQYITGVSGEPGGWYPATSAREILVPRQIPGSRNPADILVPRIEVAA